ncbi:Acetyltransferase (GNAT) domain-containing protein [Paenibacillus catalpae]|uniref:Acetyltransferase (GNAT) domain-containing protein n=1 Tax=Paenibacillus catalpae TaxID=1045775 RepID=A0A1I2D9R6_9BACL|nr:GNAT family N-acetyltransferase [Paenibacillus catalpae]SFE77209.1 Acetyltransferase (GNAT) domain-containing protein [Paenibacillus catalpae]
METTMKQVQPDNEDLHELIRKLDEDLGQRYHSPDEIFTVDFSDPAVADMIFIVAYAEGDPAGCGGIKPHGREFVELKRFYVEPAYRRHGIAAGMLSQLEGRAKEAGFSVIRLEAGAPQPEALAFYIKHGYYAIDRFGEYADSESSLCFEKQL